MASDDEAVQADDSTSDASPVRWRDRVVGLERIRPRDLLDHPHQWRTHPAQQTRALETILGEVGMAGALLAWRSERAGGRLVTFDGHGRKALDPDVPWPVLVTDLTDDEADRMIAVYDPIGDLAEADQATLAELLQSIPEVVPSAEPSLYASLGLTEQAGIFDVSPLSETPEIKDGQPELHQVTFTLDSFQRATLLEAVSAAIAQGIDIPESNKNKNGAAISAIAAWYLAAH